VLHSLAKLALELAVTVVAIGLVAALVSRRRADRAGVRAAAAPAAAALIAVLVVTQIAHALSDLNRARRDAVSARAGVEHCFAEYGAAGAARLPFIDWVRNRIGAHAIYAIDFSDVPDLLCVTFALLPARPALPGEHADWTVAFGTIPPPMQSLIARHDPSVKLFTPGFALERNR
jgi:hypothetical protein